MIKQLRIVLILVGVLIVLGGGFLFLKTSKHFNVSSSSSAAYTSIPLLNVNADKIQKVAVSNTAGSFTILRTGSSAWTVSELKNAPVLSSTVSSACTTLASLSAMSAVETNPKDLKKYGLAKPAGTIDATIAGVGEKVFYIGNQTPLETGYYLIEKGGNTVYIVSSDVGTSFLGSMLTYVDTTLVTLDTTNDIPYITQYDFGGAKQAQELKVVVSSQTSSSSSTSSASSTTSFYIDNPRLWVNSDSVTTLQNAITSISANSAVSIDTSSASLQKYGLLNPAYTFSYTLKNKVTKLLFGNTYTSGGTQYVYAMEQGRNVVYSVATSGVTFYNWGVSNLAGEMQFLTPLADLKSMSLQTPDTTYEFDFSGTGDAMTVKFRGQSLSMSNFENFYERLVADITVGGFDAKQPANAKFYCRITCNYADTKKGSDVYNFYDYNDTRLYFTANKTSGMYVLKLNVDTLLNLVKDVITGKTVATD